MKKSTKLFMLMFSLFVCMSCGTKTKEDVSDDSNTITTVDVSAELKKSEEVAAKRAKLEAARTEKEEQRRLAAIEQAKPSPFYKDASGKIVYYKAETDPLFVGGDSEMLKYLHDNVTYPASALERGVEGAVFVDFVIDEKGKVRDVVATDVIGEDVDQSFKDEAARVVASMPAWAPGRHHGVPVDTKFSIPITFLMAE